MKVCDGNHCRRRQHLLSSRGAGAADALYDAAAALRRPWPITAAKSRIDIGGGLQCQAKKWSFFENGMPGVHLTINPQKPLSAEARVHQQFLNHGLTLSAKDRESILRGREEGVDSVAAILDGFMPGFVPNTRLKLANQIVDALLDKSLSAQLSREAPTVQDQLQQETDKFNAALRAPTPTLLQQVPVGVSVTIHFDSFFDGRR